MEETRKTSQLVEEKEESRGSKAIQISLVINVNLIEEKKRKREKKTI